MLVKLTIDLGNVPPAKHFNVARENAQLNIIVISFRLKVETHCGFWYSRVPKKNVINRCKYPGKLLMKNQIRTDKNKIINNYVITTKNRKMITNNQL
jgi:hypothetical protein